MALIDIPPMPTFNDNAPLSAGDLNSLSVAHMFLKKQHGVQPGFYAGTFNAAGGALYVPEYYILHKWNYLFWQTATSFSGNLVFTDYRGTVKTIAVSGTYFGIVNISSLGLADNMPYKFGWSSTVVAVAAQEIPSNPYGISYPSSYPAITSPSKAAQLNGISANTNYLISCYTPPIPAFYELYWTGGVAFHRSRFWFSHRLRYLYVRAQGMHDYPVGSAAAEFHIRVNNSQVYGDVYNRIFQDYSIIVDLQGTDHLIYSGGFHPITVNVPPANGNYYYVEIDHVTTATARVIAVAEFDVKNGY